MKKYTGYGTVTLSIQKTVESENTENALTKLLRGLNNYTDLRKIKIVTDDGEEYYLNDLEVEWEDILEEE